ncbi:MAG TPA: bifunctional 4-hydroxy-2-oxoglutarate aldolase/2-dehydro-3-deoxy-phosphogluconate aldolase [Thermoanaerobaculia bacterium]|nr:bifunctional 4-hydroxy-2-oxoglutarate aldolase/2-dehydro-3-deoxy-phosphogluconate aldolase [Thermoanaerobaculia bacterium]
MPPALERTRLAVAHSLAGSPVIGVVRTTSRDVAKAQAEALWAGGLELVEVTFTVPGAASVVRELLALRGGEGPPWIGMGTVTTGARADEGIAAGAEFLVTPNVSPDVAHRARTADLFLVLGALTPSEIVTARELGADVVKVYPLPPVGGASYLATIRQPLGDIPMLAAGGFSVEEIPTYAAAGASAFGIGAPLFGDDAAETRRRVERALELARAGTSERR